MPRTPLSTEQILTILAATPSTLTEITSRLPEAKLQAAPHPDEWSANEVLAHLRSCADVWGSCILTILNQDHPTIRAINPRTWIERTDYADQIFHSSLKAFTVQRTSLMAVLSPLTPAAWMRSATITGAGKPLERTIHDYAQWMAEHERPHVKQIKRIAVTITQ